jgi:hypothetical protein
LLESLFQLIIANSHFADDICVQLHVRTSAGCVFP